MSGRHRSLRRLLMPVAVVVATMGMALPSTAGDGAPPPHEHQNGPTTHDNPTVPSFNESGGCGELPGARGPYARQRGYLGDSEPIRGPWGDFYGRTVGRVRSQLVPVHLPMTDAAWHVFWVHERVAPALEQVAQNLLAAEAEGKSYTIRASRSWSFHPATVPPGRHISFHSVGAAIDINSDANPYRSDNVLITDMPGWFVKAFTDAGFCWGGDWQSIKDPMHFSWMGPTHTPGYDTPPPQAPLTRVDRRFRTEVAVITPGADDTVGTPVVADLDRDGAADIGRVGPATLADHAAVTWSMSHHGHDTCVWSATTPRRMSSAETPITDDFTGDGRPDLAFATTGGDTVQLVVHDWSALWEGQAIPTSISTNGIVSVTSGDVNGDGMADLVVHRLRNEREKIEVWTGPDFGEADAKRRVRDPVSGGLLATGDHDLDGHHDVWVLAADGRLQVMYGPDFARTRMRRTFVTTQPGERLYVADYDGDGRRDIWLVGDDLSARVHLGSRTLAPHSLDWWFLEDTPHWERGEGCDPPAAHPAAVVQVAGVGETGFAVSRTSPDPGHRVVMYGAPGVLAWVAPLKGDGVDVSSEGGVVYDLATVNGRARITALDAGSGERLWVRGVNRNVTVRAMWTSGDGVTLVGTRGDRPGRTYLYEIATGRLQGRDRIKGFEATHAVENPSGMYLLGSDGTGVSALGVADGAGGVSMLGKLEGEPAWLGTTTGRLAVIVGTAVRFYTTTPDGPTADGTVDLGDVLAVAAGLDTEGDVIVAVRRTDGSHLLQRVDAATGEITTLRNLPFDLDPADLFVRDGSAYLGMVRIADHDWQVSIYGI